MSVKRTLKYVSSKRLLRIQKTLKSKRGPFKDYDTWIEVEEMNLKNIFPGHPFFNENKKFDKKETYYKVTVYYERKSSV